MANIKGEYKQFLTDNFKGVTVKSPLFFNWNLGLRFDLQKGETGSEDYFNEVVKRSTCLFESTFDSTDKVFLVFTEYKWKRRKIRFKNYCFNQIQNFKKNEVEYSIVKNLYENGKDDIYNIAVLKLNADRINYKNILTAIANTDFPPRQPRFKFSNTPNIYFVNITKNLIFHMYDDRGLDIIGSDLEIIKPIYSKFDSWILKANRKEIEARFLKTNNTK